jgi:hypothetical protein
MSDVTETLAPFSCIDGIRSDIGPRLTPGVSDLTVLRPFPARSRICLTGVEIESAYSV